MTNIERRSQSHLTCSCCNETKPIEEYYQGNLWWCKVCIRTASAHYSDISKVEQQSNGKDGVRKKYYMGRHQEKIETRAAELATVQNKIAHMQSYVSTVQQQEHKRSTAVNYAEQKLMQQGDYWVWK